MILDRLLPSLWQWVSFAEIPLDALGRSQWTLRKLFCSHLVRVCYVIFAYLPTQVCISLAGTFVIDELLKKESTLLSSQRFQFLSPNEMFHISATLLLSRCWTWRSLRKRCDKCFFSGFHSFEDWLRMLAKNSASQCWEYELIAWWYQTQFSFFLNWSIVGL